MKKQLLTIYSCRDKSGAVVFQSGKLSLAAAFADGRNEGAKPSERLKLFEQDYTPVSREYPVRVVRPRLSKTA